jgi:hypothetical protein
LQSQTLCQESKAQKDYLIEEALQTLPRGLHATYMRIVQQIEGRPQYMSQLALRTFMWIIHAKRPLRIEELQHALDTERSYQTKGNIDVDSTDVILDACGNLIVEEYGCLRPVHYSVQEFFTNPPNGTASELLQTKLLDWGAVHTTLASVCIKSLLLFFSPCKSSGDL